MECNHLSCHVLLPSDAVAVSAVLYCFVAVLLEGVGCCRVWQRCRLMESSLNSVLLWFNSFINFYHFIIDNVPSGLTNQG